MNPEALLLAAHIGGLIFIVARTGRRKNAYFLALAPITVLTVIQRAFDHWQQMAATEFVLGAAVVGLAVPFSLRWLKATRTPSAVKYTWLPEPESKRRGERLTSSGAQRLRSAGRGNSILDKGELKRLLLMARVPKRGCWTNRDRVLGGIGHVLGIALIIAWVIISVRRP